MSKLSYSEGLSAAEDIFDALKDVGESSCCLVGSQAARLFGVERKVDVSVHSSSLFFGQLVLTFDVIRTLISSFCPRVQMWPPSRMISFTFHGMNSH